MTKTTSTFIALVGWLAGAMALPASAQSQNWPVGKEREVDEGVYMRHVKTFDGWRLWRIETKNGVRCNAVKSAIGRRHPIPVGVHSWLYRGTPFLKVSSKRRGGYYYHWRTTWRGKVRVQYRSPGERFWNESGANGDDLSSFDGKKLETVLKSWEYPAALVGYAEEKAIFDLTGLSLAMSSVDQCEAETPQ